MIGVNMKEKISVVIAAAGSGSRSGLKENKIFAEVGGTPCLLKTFNAFKATGLIDEYVIAVKKGDEKKVRTLLPDCVKIVAGGTSRTESVKNALAEVGGEIVLIHDGVRPFVSEKAIKDCIESAVEYGSGIAAVSSRDTVASMRSGKPEYIGKKDVYIIHTPQAFRTEEIKDAYKNATDKIFNDDGEVYLNRFGKLHFVQGNKDNIKLTYPEDFVRGDGEKRFGVGFDCHRLTENRKLILGGVEIPYVKGLLGHSDADALTHAVMDAMLSACCLRDIGFWFPDNDEKYKDADSMKLLAKTLDLVREKGYRPESVSAVIMAEKPKLSTFIPAISENLARALNISSDKVGISATTLEGLGFVGREEGICVHATAVLTAIK